MVAYLLDHQTRRVSAGTGASVMGRLVGLPGAGCSAGVGELGRLAALVSFAGVPEAWFRRVAVTAAVTAVSVGVTGSYLPNPAAAVVDAPAQVAAPASVATGKPQRGSHGALVASDGVSAQVNARLAGERVEDLSQRTETSSTYAMPDGSWQSALSLSPVWVRTGGDGTVDDDWAEFDATLQAAGDGFRPLAHPAGITVSGAQQAGGDGVSVVASLTDPETDVTSELTFPGDLPAPAVTGERAVYVGVEPGVDMVVDVTGGGLEQYFVLHEAPTDPATVALDLGLSAEGATVEEPKKALVDLVVDGEVAARAATPMMWDATYDTQLANPVTQDWSAEQPPLWAGTPADLDALSDPDAVAGTDESAGTAEPDAAAEAGVPDPGVTAVVPVDVTVDGDAAEVTMTPGAEFLTDPDVQYPVVVDPSVSLSLPRDTFVQTDWSDDASLQTDLRVGTYNGTDKARSFLNVDVSKILGKKITSAKLNLWQFHSWSCTAKSWEVWSTGLSETGTVWGNQPSWGTKYATTSDTQGHSAPCPDAWSNVTITNLVQAWADGSGKTRGLGLRATSETDEYGWKRFNSTNASSGKPTITVSYNSYPDKPGTSSIKSGQYAWYPSKGDPDARLYVKTKLPEFSNVVTDPDGGTVRGVFDVLQGSTLIWDTKTGTSVASGSYSSFTPGSGATPLTEGASYTSRVWAHDGSLRSKTSKSPFVFTVDTTKPATPSITATGYTNGQWKDTKPSSNTFTFKSTSTDTVRFEYRLDESATWSTLTASGTTPTATYPWNPASGSHKITVRAVDKAAWTSTESTFTFGSGGAALTAPASDSKATDKFTVKATAPTAGSGTVTPSIWWRASGVTEPGDDSSDGSTTGWTKDVDLAAVQAGTAVSVSRPWSAAQAAAALGKERVPVLLDVQVCFTYSATGTVRCTWNTSKTHRSTVVRVPHAFGDNYPTAGAGPGQVALWTGEFNTSATDVSVPGYVGDLSVSRSYSSQAGPDDASVFGPGWTASFDGTDVGVAGWELVDNTGVDGTIALVDDEGGALVYRQPGGGRVLGKTGTYTAVDSETAEFGAALRKDGSVIIFTDPSGAVTRFGFAGATTSDRVWRAVSVSEPGSSRTTSFTWDPVTKQIVRILAPVPDGVTCPASGELNAGCRALDIAYGTTTANGEVAGQVKEISYTAFDPDRQGGPGMATVVVATYTYDTAGRLAKVTDPRTGLSTSYGYAGTSTSGQPLLTSVTESGMQPWKLAYGAASQDAKSLLTAHRGNPAGSGADVQVARYVYDIARDGSAGLPAMTAAAVAAWGQETAPAYGAAVFGQDRAASAAPGSADWPFADLQFTDAEGRVLATAAHGAGDWQIAATQFDAEGRVTHTWDEHATRQLRDLHAEQGELAADVVGSYATITRYNAQITAPADITWTPPGGTTAQAVAKDAVLTAAGARVTDVWEPAREVDGELVRTHTHTDYDLGAPNSGVNPVTGLAFDLPTSTTVTQADGLSGSADLAAPVATGEPVLSRETSSYNPIDAKPVTDPTSGWILGAPTVATTLMGANGTSSSQDIVTKTRYDAEGRVVEERRPGSNGADAATLKTGYYTAGANTLYPECGSKPQWAGLTCLTTTGEENPSLPVEKITKYSMYLAVAEATETRDGVTRTSTTTFDAAGRTVSTGTTVTGLSGSQPVPDTETVYDPATGLATATVSLNADGTEKGRISTSYDSWGRSVSYTDTDGATTATTYDAAGRVHTVDDTKQLVTYNYDGGGEHRGLPTTADIQGVGSFTAAYDAAGNIVTQTLPGDTVAQHLVYDRAGDLAQQSYATIPAAGAEAQEILAWSLTTDVQGRTTAVTSGAAASNTGLGRVQQFTYDAAQRLVTAKDVIGQDCTTRDYTFDVRGNRTGLTTATGTDPENPCATTGDTVTKAWSYDMADRVDKGATINGVASTGYVTDLLGRQTTIPAADTPTSTTSGDVTVGYYDTDAAHQITRDGVTTTYTLDPAGRRSSEATTGGDSVTTVVRHYTDTGDNPGWAVNTTGTKTTTSWYGASIGGDLGLETLQITDSADNTEVTAANITLADPLGSAVTSIAIPAAGTALQIAAVGSWDEYGNTLTTKADEGAINYAWLGAKERATNALTSLVLMGARLYNSTTTLFTSVDQISGGNVTAYAYPRDPVNDCDLSGLKSCSRLAREIGAMVSEIVERQRELRVNALTLPWYGRSMSVVSHQDKVRQVQRGVRTRLNLFLAGGCFLKGYTYRSDAWRRATEAASRPWNAKYYVNGQYRPIGSKFRLARLPAIRGGGAGSPWNRK
jgi:RHS repeat-associated protein